MIVKKGGWESLYLKKGGWRHLHSNHKIANLAIDGSQEFHNCNYSTVCNLIEARQNFFPVRGWINCMSKLGTEPVPRACMTVAE
jgi:hypothetical protein